MKKEIINIDPITILNELIKEMDKSIDDHIAYLKKQERDIDDNN